jgi:hypothetical protein
VLVRLGTFAIAFALAVGLAGPVEGMVVAEESAASPPPISYKQARRILLQRVIEPGELAPGDEVIAFRLRAPLERGELVAPYGGNGPVFRAKARWWFFWVDDEPQARFAHPTRYVYVNATTGRLRVVQQSWWPLVNGEAPWFDFEDYWSGAGWAFSTLEPREPPPEIERRVPSVATGLFTDECALIVDGAGDEKVGTPQDAVGMAEAMSAFGYSYVSLTRPTVAQLEANIKELAENGCKDLLVYISSHGLEGSSLVQVGNEWWGAVDLYEVMTRYPAVDFKVVVDVCYAGAWIKYLQLLGSVGKKAKIIIASSLEDEPSYGDIDGAQDPNPADEGGEFSSGLIEDLKAIPNDPALLARIQDCLKLGRSVLVCKLGLAFESALAKDAAAKAGKTSPRKVVN